MTAKEKAIELIQKFNYESKHFLMLDSKQCALIAVDELIKEHEDGADFLWSEIGYLVAPPVFWEEVKHEIKKL